MQSVVGIDVGGTFTKIGIVNKQGEILAKSKISTTQHKDYNCWIQAIKNEIINLSPNEDFSACGIGAPNANYYHQVIDNAPNLPYKGILRLSDDLSSIVNKPCKLDNDANLAAYGEKHFGGAKNMNDFVVITLGTGLGSGIYTNGNLLYGKSGSAGELGHTIAIENGRPCKCGRNGCLETYCSATGIVTTATSIFHLDVTESKQLFELAKNGNEQALSCFEYTGKILGKSLANLVSVLSPEAIFISGGLAESGEMLMQPLLNAYQADLLFVFNNTCQIKFSHLHENEVAIKGAAGLAFSLL